LCLWIGDGSDETDLICPRLRWSAADGSAYRSKVTLLFGRKRDDVKLAKKGEQLNDLALPSVLGQSRDLAQPPSSGSNDV
jgi:hypothetical protein